MKRTLNSDGQQFNQYPKKQTTTPRLK